MWDSDVGKAKTREGVVSVVWQGLDPRFKDRGPCKGIDIFCGLFFFSTFARQIKAARRPLRLFFFL